jgi:Uma2 family endonuclease
MSAHATPFFTPEEYLEVERAAEIKSEYYDGQMFAMSGGTLPHSLIGGNLIAAMKLALRGKKCNVATADLRIRISPRGPFVYADLSVYCGEPELADNYRDTLLNPTVVFEVLSKSSEGHDRGHKFSQYRKIPSLREYVLVSQTEPRIEVFLRQPEGKWILTEFVGMDAVCRLASLDCSIPLETVYDGVGLESPSA